MLVTEICSKQQANKDGKRKNGGYAKPSNIEQNIMKQAKIFISYAHEDEKIFKRLKHGIETHSKSSLKLKWDLWTDIKINAGEEWHYKIQEKIQECDAAIFLVSANAFASNYIKEHEFDSLIKRNAENGFLFFPILIGDCDFTQWQKLCKLQFFNPQGQDYGVSHKKNKILPYKFLKDDEGFLDTYHQNCVDKFEKAFLEQNSNLNQIKKSVNPLISERIDFLEANIQDGFKLKKNYMGVIIPRIGDKYIIYVYKEFSLLKPKKSIKCRIHINNKQKIKNPSLTKEDLNLEAYLSLNDTRFRQCEKIDEISVGEEYLQFKAYLKQDNHNNDIAVGKGNTLSLFYTYEVYCAHYGNELVRKTSVFPDSELVCELVYPKDDDRYQFDFYERINENQDELETLDVDRFTVETNKSILYNIQSDDFLNRIFGYVFPEDSYAYKQVNYKEMLKSKGLTLHHIYNFVVEWNSTPFLADPEMFLVMERYINDGSPSGFTKVYTPSEEYTPYSRRTDFLIKKTSVDGENRDYGTPPRWLKKNEVLIHPEYNHIFLNGSSQEILVEPTASSRTLYLKDKHCYAKIQYNKEIGRLIRSFTPEKIKKATCISSYIKKCFNSKLFSDGIYCLPEDFGRIIDLGSENKLFGSRYLGMTLRDYTPYPNKKFKNSDWRLIPGFSLFANEYRTDSENFVSKSIIELLFDYRKETSMSYEDFLLSKILKPIYKLYFELLINAGLHIEGHAQNILFLIKIEKNKVDIIGSVVRDFESVDIDMAFVKKKKHSVDWSDIASRFSRTNCLEDYQKRNSFLFDFKLGEYLITPILDHSKAIIPEFNYFYVLNEIKEFNIKYLEQLEPDFYPDKKWYSYEKVEIDRSSNERPWVINEEMPKYR